jgi:hypothetical protein
MPVLQTPRPLWHLMLTLAWVITVPLLLFAAFTGFRITDAQLDQVRKDLMNEARTLSAETAVWAPKALLDAPIRATWWTVGSTALLGFSLVLGSTLWLGRVIAHLVSRPARAAIALGVGDPLSLDETPVAEVNMLMSRLCLVGDRR